MENGSRKEPTSPAGLPDMGRKLTRAEYEAGAMALHASGVEMPTEGQELAIRHAELDLG